MPLVRKIASRYAGRGEPTEDLIQVGSIGLVLAIDRFDVERGVKFSTYAVPTIVGEIQRHFRDRRGPSTCHGGMKELEPASLARTRSTCSDGRPRPLADDRGARRGGRRSTRRRSWRRSRRTTRTPTRRSRSRSGSVTPTRAPSRTSSGRPEAGYAALEHGVRLRVGARRARRARAGDRRAAVLRGPHAVGDRGPIGISQMHVSRLLRRSLDVMRGRLEGRHGA